MQNVGLKMIDRGNGWAIHTSDTARTAFPFEEEGRADGGYNHRCYDLTVRRDMIGQLPEVTRFPFLGPVLEAVNSRWSLLRTTACDAGYLPRDPRPNDEFTHCVGGMVVIAYRLDWHNMEPDKLVRLARMIENAMVRPEPACRGRYVVEPYRSWHGKEEPMYYNVTLEFAGVGYSPEEALVAAETTAQSITPAISKVATSHELLTMS